MCFPTQTTKSSERGRSRVTEEVNENHIVLLKEQGDEAPREWAKPWNNKVQSFKPFDYGEWKQRGMKLPVIEK